MTSLDQKCVREARNGTMLFAFGWPLYFSLHEVSSSKTYWENTFFVKLMYVTICDLHGHRRSQSCCEMKGCLRSYLSIIATIGLSVTVTEI